jgi:hypothetical protein
MRDHHFLDTPEPPHNIRYNLVFSEDTRDIIPLPAPALFDSVSASSAPLVVLEY